MKKLVLALALLFVPMLVVAPVAAQLNPLDPVCEAGVTDDASVCNTDGSDPISGSEGIIIRVVEMLGWVVGFAAVVMLIIAGIKFITANGDASSIKSARDTVIYALIGVAVFAVSQLIVQVILSRL